MRPESLNSLFAGVEGLDGVGPKLAKPLERVMTRKPICIREDALAVEALKVFDAHNIDDLIVVNAKQEPVGLVDSQDLPKLKLM